jgi:hypothetical protein
MRSETRKKSGNNIGKLMEDANRLGMRNMKAKAKARRERKHC